MDELWNDVADWMIKFNVVADQPRAVRAILDQLKDDALHDSEPSAKRTKRIILCNIAIRQHDQLFPEFAE